MIELKEMIFKISILYKYNSSMRFVSRIISRQRSWCFLLISLFSMVSMVSANAQESDLNLKDFSSVLNHLGSLPSFQYSSVTNAVFADGKKEVMHTFVAVDKKSKSVWYKNDFQLLIFNKSWTFGVNFVDKAVTIFNNQKYEQYKKVMPNPNQFFNKNPLSELIDTTMLKIGKLTFAKRKGDLGTFKMEFPKSFYIRNIILVFDYENGLPQSFYVRYVRSAGRSFEGSEQASIFETVSKDYTITPDIKLFDTAPYFKMVGKKIILLKYKNFKVNSIL